MSPTPEARLTRWRTTANAVWAIIGILILVRGEWLGGGQGRERACPLRSGVPARVLHAGSRGGLRQAGSGQGRRCGSHLRHRFRRRLDTGRLPGSTREQASRRVREGRTKLLRCREDVRLHSAGTLKRSGRSGVASGHGRLETSSALSAMAVRIGNAVAQGILSAGSGIATVVFDVFLGLVVAFWVLKDQPKIRDGTAGARRREVRGRSRRTCSPPWCAWWVAT